MSPTSGVDFVTLRSNLLAQEVTDVGYILPLRIPDIPSKEIGISRYFLLCCMISHCGVISLYSLALIRDCSCISSVDDSTVKKRSVGLQRFVDGLFENPSALSNHHGRADACLLII